MLKINEMRLEDWEEHKREDYSGNLVTQDLVLYVSDRSTSLKPIIKSYFLIKAIFKAESIKLVHVDK
jgi:hypothetical protein